MEPETYNETITEVVEEKSVLHTVTPLSKYLAMALFIVLPFVGGWIGYHYAPEKVIEIEKVVEVQKNEIEPTNLNEFELIYIDGANRIPESWSTYENKEIGIEAISYPNFFELKEDDNVASFVVSEGCDIEQVTLNNYCSNRYAFVVQQFDYVLTKELIDSWGGETALITDNGGIDRKNVWFTVSCAGTGCISSVNFIFENKTTSIIFYGNFYDPHAKSNLSDLAQQIISTLQIDDSVKSAF